MIDELKAILREISPQTNLDKVTEDTRLQQDLGMNSLSLMLVAMAIEDRYHIELDETANFQTVGDVVRYIQAKI